MICLKNEEKVSLHVMGCAVLLLLLLLLLYYAEMNLDMFGNVGMFEVSFMYCTGT